MITVLNEQKKEELIELIERAGVDSSKKEITVLLRDDTETLVSHN